MKPQVDNCLIKIEYFDVLDLHHPLVIKYSLSALTLLGEQLRPNPFYNFQVAVIDCNYAQSFVILQLREYTSCMDF